MKEEYIRSKNHPNRGALQADLMQNQTYNPFSEKSKNMIHEMMNVEYLELCETISKVQCPCCLSYWTRHCVLHMRNLFVHYGENAKIVKGSIRHIIDSKLCDQEGSYPWCSSRKHRRAKNSSHGLQHVQEMQKEEKRWYIGSLSEQTKVQSSTSGTWVDRRVVCKTRRTCAGGPFIHVNNQRTPTPRINLDSSSQQFGQNGQMSERPDYAEAVRIKNRLYAESREAEWENSSQSAKTTTKSQPIFGDKSRKCTS